MEFRILGPLEVVSDDGPLPVPGAKPRALLALLLAHANRVVTTDRLAEDLWEASPPKSPDTTLQLYVHRLRNSLGLGSLFTRAGGYVLEVKDSDVDALRFERVVAEVSQVKDASPGWVSLQLSEALGWWRGDALAGFADAAWARTEAERLGELRLGALEDLMEARLSLGEHRTVVPELESLVSEHPLRERLWGQLMLALYRCDRQADALRVYQRVRTALAGELGLEPGPGLVELERRILDHDATLIAPASGPAAVVRDDPVNEPGVHVPTPPTSFVGRGTVVDEVARLVASHRLVTLTGAGGCGKTRLAIEVTRRLAGDFADGARFADLAAITDEAKVGDAVVAALGLAQDPTRTDPIDRLARYLDTRELLSVLDNCEHVLDACAALAAAVLSRGGPGRLLATSREPLGIAGEQVYVVPSLDIETEATPLFAERAGEARAGFAVDDTIRGTVIDICTRLDGIPLAIELAAARVRHLSPAQLLQRLDDRFALLSATRRIPRHRTLAATLDWSYELLDAREQEVLRCLAVFPTGFSLEAAEAVVGGADTVAVLGSLVAKSLLQTVDDGEQLRYRLLETVRLYVRDRRTPSEAERCAARHRDWVLDWLESIPLEERQFGDPNAAGPEYASIRSALEWSQIRGETEAVAHIAAHAQWWRVSEYWREGIRWYEAAGAATATLPPEVQAELYLMLCGQATLNRPGPEDWHQVARWAQRAIDAAGQSPSPLHADALNWRAIATAVAAVAGGDESLARQAAEDTTVSVAMSEPFSVPRRMYNLLVTGLAHAVLGLAWPEYAQTAQRNYAIGIDLAEPAPPFLAVHAELRAQLASERFAAGDTSHAGALAREALRVVGRSQFFSLDIPLALAAIVAVATGNDAGSLHAQLRAYHNASLRRDLGLQAAETTALFGGICAAMREEWGLASRLLAAGAGNPYRLTAVTHLYVHFRDQVEAALGPELSRKLEQEGQTMSLDDAVAAALG
jgi:predicted ATPase/DNA-binding SARP family transcriptional activator